MNDELEGLEPEERLIRRPAISLPASPPPVAAPQPTQPPPPPSLFDLTLGRAVAPRAAQMPLVAANLLGESSPLAGESYSQQGWCRNCDSQVTLRVRRGSLMADVATIAALARVACPVCGCCGTVQRVLANPPVPTPLSPVPTPLSPVFSPYIPSVRTSNDTRSAVPWRAVTSAGGLSDAATEWQELATPRWSSAPQGPPQEPPHTTHVTAAMLRAAMWLAAGKPVPSAEDV